MAEQASAYDHLFGPHLVVDVKAGSVPQRDIYVDARLNEETTAWMREWLTVAA